MYKFSPGWWGAVCILSNIPTVEPVRLLLRSGEFDKGQDIGSLEVQFVCSTHLASFDSFCYNKNNDRFMMPAGFNRNIGLDDKLFVLADSVLVTGLGRIALMPCLVLAARVCPEVTHQ